MHFLLDFFLFPILGLVCGTLSGLLGLGGTVVTVPGLYFLLGCSGFPKEYLMQFAIGTSLAVMMCTASVNIIFHVKKNNVVWPIIKIMTIFTIIGVVTGRILIKHADNKVLSFCFGLFLLFVSMDLFFKLAAKIFPSRAKIKKGLFRIIAFFMGILSGFLGIGGGSIIVPLFVYSGIKVRKCVGTSVVLTLPVAITGTLLSSLSSKHTGNIPLTFGYIYLPAFILVAAFSILSVPIGVKLLEKLPAEMVKKIFALLLATVAIKMIF